MPNQDDTRNNKQDGRSSRPSVSGKRVSKSRPSVKDRQRKRENKRPSARRRTDESADPVGNERANSAPVSNALARSTGLKDTDRISFQVIRSQDQSHYSTGSNATVGLAGHERRRSTGFPSNSFMSDFADSPQRKDESSKQAYDRERSHAHAAALARSLQEKPAEKKLSSDDVPPVKRKVSPDSVPPVKRTVSPDSVPPVKRRLSADAVPQVKRKLGAADVPAVKRSVSSDDVPPVTRQVSPEEVPAVERVDDASIDNRVDVEPNVDVEPKLHSDKTDETAFAEGVRRPAVLLDEGEETSDSSSSKDEVSASEAADVGAQSEIVNQNDEAVQDEERESGETSETSSSESEPVSELESETSESGSGPEASKSESDNSSDDDSEAESGTEPNGDANDEEDAGAAKPGDARPTRRPTARRVSRDTQQPNVGIFHGVKINLKVVVPIVLILAIALGVSWGRWWHYDDALDIQGEWLSEDTQGVAVVTVDGQVIKLASDVSYVYELDTTSKTISYTFGDMQGSGRYWFSDDRNTLVILDGDYSATSTFFDDVALWWENVFSSIQGGDTVVPSGDHSIELARSGTSAADSINERIASQSANTSESTGMAAGADAQ